MVEVLLARDPPDSRILVVAMIVLLVCYRLFIAATFCLLLLVLQFGRVDNPIQRIMVVRIIAGSKIQHCHKSHVRRMGKWNEPDRKDLAHIQKQLVAGLVEHYSHRRTISQPFIVPKSAGLPLTNSIYLNFDPWRHHPVPFEDARDQIARAQRAQYRYRYGAGFERGDGTERMHEGGVGREVSLKGAALFVGRALRKGADHIADLVLYDGVRDY